MDADFQELFSSRQSLVKASRQLRQLHPSDAETQTFDTALSAIDFYASEIDEVTRRIAKPMLFTEMRPSEGYVTAQVFFDVTEMLEKVLSFLDIQDILTVQQVNTTMYSTIAGSSKLQRQLHLEPDTEAYLRDIMTSTVSIRRTVSSHGESLLETLRLRSSKVQRVSTTRRRPNLHSEHGRKDRHRSQSASPRR